MKKSTSKDVLLYNLKGGGGGLNNEKKNHIVNLQTLSINLITSLSLAQAMIAALFTTAGDVDAEPKHLIAYTRRPHHKSQTPFNDFN